MSRQIKIFSSRIEAEKALPVNKPRKLILNGKALCIVRTDSGLFVTDDICPHNKTSLSGGWINAYQQIICPLHEYRYDLHTGRESAQRCSDLQTFEVSVKEEGVFLII